MANTKRAFKSVASLVVWLLLPFVQTLEGAGYYVSPSASNASDANSGTEALPWKTLNKANATLRAGDTVYLKAGTYNTYINPANSGTPTARITYQNFGSDVVTITGTSYAVFLDGKDYITVQGIKASLCARFLYILNGADHNVVAYCSFDESSEPAEWDVSVIYTSSQYNQIHHCQFSKGGECTAAGSDDGEVLGIGDESSATDLTRFNLIEDCVFFHGGHHVVALMASYNTVRNNYFHNEAWSRSRGNRTLYMNGKDPNAGHNLIEGNRFGYAAQPCDDFTVGNVAMSTPFNIFRYNKIFHSNAYGLSFSYYNGYSSGSSNRVYNNTIFNSGYKIYPTYQNSQENSAVMFWYAPPVGNALKNNLYSARARVYGVSGNSLANQSFANNWDGDTQGNPLFVNASTNPPADKSDLLLPNLDIRAGSPVLNAGGALTAVAGGDVGSGTSMLLADSTYFQDGSMAPPGTVQADWIAIGNVTNVAQIASISGNTVRLINGVSRRANDPVWLYKRSDGVRVLYESGPDIGAFEYTGSSPAPAPPTNLRVVVP